MKITHTPLQENDFQSAEEFQTYTEAKDRVVLYSERNNTFDYIHAEKDPIKRGRIVADLIHDEKLDTAKKTRLAEKFYFQNFTRDQSQNAIVPSAETFVVLSKLHLYAMHNDYYEFSDYLARYHSITAEDYQKICTLEKEQNAPSTTSRHVKNIAQNYAVNQFRTAKTIEGLLNAQTEINRVSDVMDVPVYDMAYKLKVALNERPSAWNEKGIELHKAQDDFYYQTVSQEFNVLTSKPSGESKEEQIKNVVQRIEYLSHHINDHQSVYQKHPDRLINGLQKISDYKNEIDMENNYLPSVANRVAHTINDGVKERKIKPDTAVSLLMDVAEYQNKNSRSAYHHLQEIIENASHQSMPDVTHAYIEKNNNPDKNPRLYGNIHQKLLNAIERKPNNITPYVDAAFDLDVNEKKLHTYTTTRNHSIVPMIQVFEKVPTEQARHLMGRMLTTEDYTNDLSSDYMANLVQTLKSKNDPALTHGAVIFATGSLTKNLKNDYRSTGQNQMAEIYGTLANKAGRKEMRHILRTQGEENGLSKEDINNTLQAMRQSYNKNNGILERAQQTLKSWFGDNEIDMSGITSPKPKQEQTLRM
jgi:ribosomal protein S15P/S13E